jgi:hypothetical protein
VDDGVGMPVVAVPIMGLGTAPGVDVNGERATRLGVARATLVSSTFKASLSTVNCCKTQLGPVLR